MAGEQYYGVVIMALLRRNTRCRVVDVLHKQKRVPTAHQPTRHVHTSRQPFATPDPSNLRSQTQVKMATVIPDLESSRILVWGYQQSRCGIFIRRSLVFLPNTNPSGVGRGLLMVAPTAFACGDVKLSSGPVA